MSQINCWPIPVIFNQIDPFDFSSEVPDVFCTSVCIGRIASSFSFQLLYQNFINTSLDVFVSAAPSMTSSSRLESFIPHHLITLRKRISTVSIECVLFLRCNIYMYINAYIEFLIEVVCLTVSQTCLLPYFRQ